MEIPEVAVVLPEVDCWAPSHLVRDVLEMRKKAYDNGKIGPYVLLYGPGWDKHMNAAYRIDTAAKVKQHPRMTLRGRLLDMEGIVSVAESPELENYEMVLAEIISTSGDIQCLE